jgi:ABC-type taurine transport system substrate-binding protein
VPTARDLCLVLDRMARENDAALQSGEGICQAALAAELVGPGDRGSVGRSVGRSTKARAVSATSRQPPSIVSAWPRCFISTVWAWPCRVSVMANRPEDER